MKRIFTHLIYILLASASLAQLLSCHKDEADRWDHPGRTMERTLIIYMAGENSLSSFVSSDSAEIARGLKDVPEGCRVVLYMDDSRGSRLCVGMHDQPLQVVCQYPRNICSTDSTDMEQVLGEIFKRYPAESYGLVMWSHASGWVFAKGRQSRAAAPRRSFGIDNGQRSSSSNSGPQMDIPTLAKVLSHHPHLDFLFFDACFMQCIEVAYELRNVADWVMGSPAEIPGDGAPYDQLLGMLGTRGISPQLLLQAYYEYYTEGLGAIDYHGVILSAIRTSELPQLVAATAPLISEIMHDRTLPACWGVQSYFPVDREDYADYFAEFYDMSHFLNMRCSEGVYDQWRLVLERAVPYRFLSERWSSGYSRSMRVDDPDNCAAVSMFVPTSLHSSDEWINNYHRLEWYDAVKLSSTGW